VEEAVVAVYQDLMRILALAIQDNPEVVVVVGQEHRIMKCQEVPVTKDTVVLPHFISMVVLGEEWVKLVKLIVGDYQQKEVMVRTL
jgi:hypothetical protein